MGNVRARNGTNCPLLTSAVSIGYCKRTVKFFYTEERKGYRRDCLFLGALRLSAVHPFLFAVVPTSPSANLLHVLKTSVRHRRGGASSRGSGRHGSIDLGTVIGTTCHIHTNHLHTYMHTYTYRHKPTCLATKKLLDAVSMAVLRRGCPFEWKMSRAKRRRWKTVSKTIHKMAETEKEKKRKSFTLPPPLLACRC